MEWFIWGETFLLASCINFSNFILIFNLGICLDRCRGTSLRCKMLVLSKGTLKGNVDLEESLYRRIFVCVIIIITSILSFALFVRGKKKKKQKELRRKKLNYFCHFFLIFLLPSSKNIIFLSLKILPIERQITNITFKNAKNHLWNINLIIIIGPKWE